MPRQKNKKNDEEYIEIMSPMPFMSQMPEKELADRGIVLINNSISKDTLNDAYQKILTLHFNPDFQDEIQIILNSPGGYADGGWAFIDLLNFVKNPIRTIATGEIASMATIIFIAGDYRIMTPNSTAMIHQFTSGSQGTYGDLVAARKSEELEQTKHLNHYLRNSKYTTVKQITDKILLNHDNWLSPEEMLEHGLCDEVMKIRPRNAKKK